MMISQTAQFNSRFVTSRVGNPFLMCNEYFDQTQLDDFALASFY